MTDRQMFKLVDANTVPSKDGSLRLWLRRRG